MNPMTNYHIQFGLFGSRATFLLRNRNGRLGADAPGDAGGQVAG